MNAASSAAAGPGRPASSDPPRSALERVLVGFDGSPASVRATRFAISIGRPSGTRLWLVHAHERDSRLAEPLTEEEVSSPARALARSMERLVREARAAGLDAEAMTREGPPFEVLLRVAQEVRADAIVVGTRGLGGASRVLLGSVSSHLTVGAPVPVTVVP